MSLAFILISMLLLQHPNAVITSIGIDQKLGAQLSLDTPFRDELGNDVALGSLFRGKPIVLTPVYFDCPMLCSMQLNGLVRALRVMPYTAGKEFDILTFSIDPDEGPDLAKAKKQHYIRDYGKPETDSGWRFLTGSAESIRKLTDEIGFRYTFDEHIGQWAHVSAVMVLTPDGRISRYFYGIEQDANDLKFGLIEASDGKIGSLVERALLFCYQYNPEDGKYSLSILRAVRIAGISTVLSLAAFMIISIRRTR